MVNPISYCVLHDTYPTEGEPCWDCVREFGLKPEDVIFRDTGTAIPNQAPDKLPEYQDAHYKVKTGKANPLEVFIQGNEPAGWTDSIQFRDTLLDALHYYATQFAQEPNKDPINPKRNLPEVWGLVFKDMQARDHMGKQKYGVPLTPFCGRDPLIDLYQELLDSVAYARQALYEKYGR